MSRRFEQLRLRILGDSDADTSVLASELPVVSIEHASSADPADIVVDDHAWYGAFDLTSLDEKVAKAGSRPSIAVRGYDVAQLACEVVTRYQRYLDRRNEASSDAVFDRILSTHAALYDVDQPDLRSELDHAIDTWQWVLRLEPHAGRAVQIAALFHDVERLEAAGRQRLEHRVPDGQAQKDASARAERVLGELLGAGVQTTTVQRAREIVYSAERRGGDREVLLLDDADTLSFMSLCSASYSDYFGVAQTRRKVAYMVSRLGPSARERLVHIRLRPDVERLLREVAA